MNEAKMIFVIGNSRSGTTMMGRILGRNPAVFTFHELHFFEELWSAQEKDKKEMMASAIELYAHLLKAERIGYLVKGDPKDFKKEASDQIKAALEQGIPLGHDSIFAYFMCQEAEKNGKSVPCEQTPRNVLYLKEILDLYPNAKIINMVRDPRDILLSQKKKWKVRFLGSKTAPGARDIPLKESFRSWMNYHPITMSRLWKLNLSSVIKYSEHPSVHLVKFEDFLAAPQQHMKEICAFAGISYNKDMLNVPQIGSSNAADKDNDKTGVDRSKQGAWKTGGLNKTEIYYCQHICKEEMEQFDYPIQQTSPNPIAVGGYALSFPIKLIGSFLLNIRRMKNIGEAIKRRIGA